MEIGSHLLKWKFIQAVAVSILLYGLPCQLIAQLAGAVECTDCGKTTQWVSLIWQ